MKAIRKFLRDNGMICTMNNANGIIANDNIVWPGIDYNNAVHLTDDYAFGYYKIDKIEAMINAGILTADEFWNQIKPFEIYA